MATARKTTMFILKCFDDNELKRIKNELLPKLGMDLKLVQLILLPLTGMKLMKSSLTVHRQIIAMTGCLNREQ
ncbi:Glycerophosphoryl diester phosphodiesterase [Arsenophonus endosymbiont of Bemisia tabaci Q2]|nr:Glycerophosphoryl diester phosphodiesterase [Arsenophonus endosymbiont of Bemisia tabaci Q2]